MNIETVFTRSKMVKAKYWEFLTKSYLTKIFKSRATSWYTVSQNEPSLHSKVPFELTNYFQRYYLFAIERCKIKINNVKVSRKYPPYYPKKTYVLIPGHIFAQWTMLQDKYYQCSHSYTRGLKHNSSILLLAIVIVIIFLK